MKEIRVEIDTERLKEVIREFRMYAETAQTCLEDMKEELGRLNAAWEGKAGQTFYTRTARELARMEDILKEIRKCAACMEYAGEEYGRSEQEIETYMRELCLREEGEA